MWRRARARVRERLAVGAAQDGRGPRARGEGGEAQVSRPHLREGRVGQDVGEQLDRLRHVLLEDLGVVDRLLTRRVSVQVAAHVLDLRLELQLRPLRSALEGHVLEEVCDAVVSIGLVPAPGVDPHAERGGLTAGALTRHAHLVGQRRHQSRLLRRQRREAPASGRGAESCSPHSLSKHKEKDERRDRQAPVSRCDTKF